MKILLLGTYPYDERGSMQRFTRILFSDLSNLGHDVRVVYPDTVFAKLKPSKDGFGKWLGYIDKFFLFPKKLTRELSWADIIHIPDHSDSIYVKYVRNFPHVVTCHDLIAIRSAHGELNEKSTMWTGKMLQRIILDGLKKAGHVVCVSQTTKQDLLRLSLRNPMNTSMAYLDLDKAYHPMGKSEAIDHLRHLGINNYFPFMLHVGQEKWYKNRIGVLEIFYYLKQIDRIKNLYLIFVGDILSNEMNRFITKHNLHNHIKALPFLGINDVRAFYSSAEFLLFPSYYEGFGWPIAEAQACGCPVFTTNKQPMTEVGRDAAIYIDPHKPREAADIIAGNLGGLDAARNKGFQNIKRFQTNEMAKHYVRIYQRVLNESL